MIPAALDPMKISSAAGYTLLVLQLVMVSAQQPNHVSISEADFLSENSPLAGAAAEQH